MNRRGFLSLLAGTAVAPLVPAPELWLPTKTIFLPPTGGWIAKSGNRLLTIEEIIRGAMEALKATVENDVERIYTASLFPAEPERKVEKET